MNVRSGIENTLALYAWAYDMDELDRILECFTEDCQIWFTAGMQVGHADCLAEFEKMRETFRSKQLVPWHVISNVHVSEYTDAEAAATSFYTFLTKPVDGGAPTTEVIGYYDDRFRKEDGMWRVSRRRVCSGGLLFPDEWPT